MKKYCIEIQNISSKIRANTDVIYMASHYTLISILGKIINLTIRIVSIKDIYKLNKTFSFIKKATNVLAFPFYNQLEYLGDIAICPEIIYKESINIGKYFNHHLAHIVVHGTLHLLGYNHKNNTEAIIMENIEKKILENLCYINPY